MGFLSAIFLYETFLMALAWLWTVELLLTHLCFGVELILDCLEICTIVGFVTFAGEGYTMWDQGWSYDIF
jgi:hypothetical protein